MSSKKAAEPTNIRVMVRTRPLSEAEKKKDTPVVVQSNAQRKDVTVSAMSGVRGKSFKKKFSYDSVYGQFATQDELFRGSIAGVVDEVLEGFNCTVFAYGQTGTGKTFTMTGELGDPVLEGIVPRSIKEIFTRLENDRMEYTIKVSCLQIYNEELQDLLEEEAETKKPLRIFEDRSGNGVSVPDLVEEVVTSADDIFNIIQKSIARRSSAATKMNKFSSRSHCIFTVTIHSKQLFDDGEQVIRTGKLNLVDLAGSECIGKSGAVEDRAKETGKINKSLLTLGRVISKLVDGNRHIPYRDSKLTRLLQESLGGRAKTVIIATVSPSLDCMEETLNTLEYAHRAKDIKNKPQVNETKTQKAYVKELNTEIGDLHAQLEASRQKNGIYLPPDQYERLQHDIESKSILLKEYEVEITQRRKGMSELQQQYNEQSTALKRTENAKRDVESELRSTIQQLLDTKQGLAEQSHLVEAYSQTEKVLGQEAVQTRAALEESLAIEDGLWQHVDRRQTLEENHLQLAQQLDGDVATRVSKLQNSLSEFRENQETAFTASRLRLSTMMEQQSALLCALTGTVTKDTSQMNDCSTAVESSLVSYTGVLDSHFEALTQIKASASQEHKTLLEQHQNALETQCSALVASLASFLHAQQEAVSQVESRETQALKKTQAFISETQNSMDALADAVSESDAKLQQDVQQWTHALKEKQAFETESFSKSVDSFQKQVVACMSTMNEAFAATMSSLSKDSTSFAASASSESTALKQRITQQVASMGTLCKSRTEDAHASHTKEAAALRSLVSSTSAFVEDQQTAAKDRFDAQALSLHKTRSEMDQLLQDTSRVEEEAKESTAAYAASIRSHMSLLSTASAHLEGESTATQSAYDAAAKEYLKGEHAHLDTKKRSVVEFQQRSAQHINSLSLRVKAFSNQEMAPYQSTGETPVKSSITPLAQFSSTDPVSLLSAFRAVSSPASCEKSDAAETTLTASVENTEPEQQTAREEKVSMSKQGSSSPPKTRKIRSRRARTFGNDETNKKRSKLSN